MEILETRPIKLKVSNAFLVLQIEFPVFPCNWIYQWNIKLMHCVNWKKIYNSIHLILWMKAWLMLDPININNLKTIWWTSQFKSSTFYLFFFFHRILFSCFVFFLSRNFNQCNLESLIFASFKTKFRCFHVKLIIPKCQCHYLPIISCHMWHQKQTCYSLIQH